VNKVDPRLFVTASFAVFALVLFMRARFNTSADELTLLIPTLIQGAAVAVFFIPLVTLSLTGLSPDRIPSASGLFNFARITAGSFGTSIATTFWDRRASLHHAQLAERITQFDPTSTHALSSLQAGGMSVDQSYGALNRMLDQQAFMLSANDIFYVSALLFLALIAVVWLAKPAKATAGAAQAAAGAH
jgi:DHA2 family multidrug resistance protein